MAKEYKDHGSGRVYGNSIVPRLVFAILLVTIGILGYSFWTLLNSHRDATTKMTQLRQDLDSTQSARTELTKMMESCKDELKSSREEQKRLKDSETTLEGQLKALKEAQVGLEKEKTSLEEKLKKELNECRDIANQEVSSCNASCNEKVAEVKKAADEACQKQRFQPVATVEPRVQAGTLLVNGGNDGIQHNPQ